MAAFPEILPQGLFFAIWGWKSLSQDEEYQKIILNINSVKIFEATIRENVFSSSLLLILHKGFIITSLIFNSNKMWIWIFYWLSATQGRTTNGGRESVILHTLFSWLLNHCLLVTFQATLAKQYVLWYFHT